MKAFDIVKNGILKDNPIFRLVLGMCPTLATTTSIENGVGMGLATTAVLVGSNTVISSIRKFIPAQVRIPCYIVVIASFVTIVEMLMKAFVPARINESLGIFIPLIVVNCIILGRAEAFAYHNTVWLSVADGLGMGLGFSLVITVLAFIREFFGTGQLVFFGETLLAMPSGYQPPGILMLFPGAFIVFGFMVAGSKWLNGRLARKAG